MNKLDITEQRFKECGEYYDVLDNFARMVVRINKMAADGLEDSSCKHRFLKLLPAFVILCGGDLQKEVPRLGRKPKEETKQEPLKPKTVLQVNLKIINGWGICPTCGKKCIKVKDDTILVNYPMFCKVCKREYPVTWKYSG